MTTFRRFIVALAAALCLAVCISTIYAQEAAEAVRSFYYLAQDDAGVWQIYQQTVGGGDGTRQVTFADADILDFNVAYDGLSAAYVSGGQLWLQPIHTEEAEALAAVSGESGALVYSQDGQFIAYTDAGVWLFDLAARETRQIFADEPAEGENPDANDPFATVYRPDHFISDTDGAAEKLVFIFISGGWPTPAVYDLATDAVNVLSPQLQTDALALSDGSVLLYGNLGISGDLALHLASDPDNLDDHVRILDFDEVTPETLYAQQAVEIRPGVVRVSGELYKSINGTMYLDEETGDYVTVTDAAFVFDYDVAADSASGFRIFVLNEADDAYGYAGNLSPDGAVLPVYVNGDVGYRNTQSGHLTLIDTATGEPLGVDLPETVGVLRWQP